MMTSLYSNFFKLALKKINNEEVVSRIENPRNSRKKSANQNSKVVLLQKWMNARRSLRRGGGLGSPSTLYSQVQHDQINMVALFWYLVKRGATIHPIGHVMFNKVPQTHGHV